MRQVTHPSLNAARIRQGRLHSDDSYGNNGAFEIHGPRGATLCVIASDGIDPIAQGWEHASVSLPSRPPNWAEMCFIKELFWSDDEVVLQFHPDKQSYVNVHPHCLHLWRHRSGNAQLPPQLLVA